MAMRSRRQLRAKGDHTMEECNHTVKGLSIHYHPHTAKEGKPFVQHLTGDTQENIIIPSREPLAIPGILAHSDYDRLKKQAKVLTREEKNEMIREAENKKKMLHVESEKRKETLRKMQNQASEKGSILEEAESEAIKKNQYMLQRAHELRQEQEDEVKTLNGIILASKCLAIREAQIIEKKIIEKELDDEDRRLDMMMEQNRQRAMLQEKKAQKQSEERNRQFVNEVKEQLKANEIHSLVEREKRAEEARSSNKLLIAFQKAQLDEIQEKKKRQERARDDLRKSNEAQEQYKALKEAEDRLLDLRLREFVVQKEKKEEERAAQAAIMKQCKESDIQRLGEKVREQRDLAQKREEMNIFRLHEEVEREWRKKQLEEAQQRKEGIEKLRIERKKQIEDIREAQAIAIARDQEEFFKVCKIQRANFERVQAKRKEDKLKAEKNRKELLKQVNLKEKERIERRRLLMEEGEAQRLETEVRKMKLMETLDRKLENLKDCSIPDKTLTDIKRQAEKKIKSHVH